MKNINYNRLYDYNLIYIYKYYNKVYNLYKVIQFIYRTKRFLFMIMKLTDQNSVEIEFKSFAHDRL